MRKWLLIALLTLCMAFTLLPVSAMAVSSEAQWGVAAADGTKPAEWAGSGTLAEAVTYANGLNDGAAYIQLLSDLTTTVTVPFTQGTTTLDLNGYTLTSGNLSGVITLNGGTLTIEDSSEGGNGKVTTVGNQNNTINVNGGNLCVDGGIVTGGSNTINNMGSGTVNVNGGIVTGGFNTIYNRSGTVSVTGGEVSGNNTVINSKGTVRMTGGTVKNTSNNAYTTIINDGSGSVSIDGGEVSGYYTIFMPQNSTSTVSVTGGKVIVTGTGNYAIESQGKGSISVSGGEIIGRSGAIRCSEYSTANVSVTGGKLTSTGFWTIFNYGTALAPAA